MKLTLALILFVVILFPQQSFARSKHKTRSNIQMPSSISEITPEAPSIPPLPSTEQSTHPTTPTISPTPITTSNISPTPVIFDLNGYDVNEDFSTNSNRVSWTIFDRIVSAVLKNMLGQFGFFSMLV